jgi:ribose transport system permease protein
MFTGGASAGGLTQAALTFAAFSVIVGLGQMFVITLGPGNIDLSIPATMTLAGTVALKVMDAANGTDLLGLASPRRRLAVGIGNYALIKALRIPPIIATLSTSFIIQSTAIWTNRGLRIKPPDGLADFSTGSPSASRTSASSPSPSRSPPGSCSNAPPTAGRPSPSARTSAPRAGRRAGRRRALATYVLCATLAALCGFLLSCFSGGAALNMGAEYLLISIAVVVIGGTSVAGGNSNVPGIWGAALFMFLVVSMLNTYGFGAGFRLIMTGLIIIAVIIAAGGTRRVRA